MKKIVAYILLSLLIACKLCGAEGLYDPVAVYLTWQHAPDSTMSVQWISDLKRPSDRIDYREQGASTWYSEKGVHFKMPDGSAYLIHSTEIFGLKPDTIYEFRVGEEGKPFKFKTLPSKLESPFIFAVGGDIYQGSLSDVRKMNKEVAKKNPLFVLVGGDIAYTTTGHQTLMNRIGLDNEKSNKWVAWLAAWKEDMVTSDGRLIPIIPAIGNHDVTGGYDQTPEQAPFFYTLFPFPGKAGYNVLDVDSYLSIIVLDSGHTHPVGGKQTEWLGTILENRAQIPNKFALYHVGAYPSVRSFMGEHHAKIRKNWVPLFDKFGLTAAFEHHDHDYKRTFPLKNGEIDPKGVLYLGDGGWGVKNPRKPENRWYIAKSASSRNVIVVVLSKKNRYYEAINENGETIDTFVQEL